MVANKERIPLSGLSIHMIFKKDRVRWFIRFLTKRHICFFRCIVAFFCIAFFTSGHKIGPCVCTTARSGHNMIDCQVFACSAILTLVVVAFKYILPGKINALVRGVNISIQAYHRWHRVRVSDRMQLVAIRGSNHLALVEKNENECPLYGAYHQRTVILIQHQNATIHECKIVAIRLRSKTKIRQKPAGKGSKFNVPCSRLAPSQSHPSLEGIEKVRGSMFKVQG